MKGEVYPFEFRKFIFVGFGWAQTKFCSQRTQDMPGDTIVFTVRVSVADDQSSFQVKYLGQYTPLKNQTRHTNKNALLYLVC